MITFLLKLCILCYLFYMIYRIHDMIQYNKNATIQTVQIPDKEKVIHELQKKQPLLIIYPENKLNLTINNMNSLVPGYIINDKETLLGLDQLSQSKEIEIIDNQKLITDFNLSEHCDKVMELVKGYSTCDISYKLSLLRGSYKSRLYKNYRECLLLQSLDNSYTLYLFNPKHENEIKGLDTDTIKKWGIKIDVAKDTILSIPTEWSYFYECRDELLLSKYECDSIPTWLFNRIRKK